MPRLGRSDAPRTSAGGCLHGVAEMLDERRDRLAADLAAADGIAVDAAAELVDAAVDRWVWYAGWTDKIAGVLGAVHPVAGPYVGWSAPPTGRGGRGRLACRRCPRWSTRWPRCWPPARTAVVRASRTSGRCAAAALAEVLATADLPGGVANVLTGPVGELAPGWPRTPTSTASTSPARPTTSPPTWSAPRRTRRPGAARHR